MGTVSNDLGAPHRSTGSPLAALALLSLRYWRRRLGWAVSSVLGVALGVALVVAVVAVNQAVLRTYSAWVETLSGRALIEVRAVESGGMDAAMLEVVRAAQGVATAGGVVEQRSYLFTEGSQAAVTIRGVDAVVESSIRPVRIIGGRQLDARDDTATVLSSSAANALDLSVGESVSLLSADGLLELRVVGIYGSLDAGTLDRDRTALLPLATAQTAFMQGRDAITQVDVLPVAPGNLDELHASLASLAAPEAFVRLPADEVRELTTATRGLRTLLLLAGAMALVAAVFLIGNNLAAGIEERSRDLGVVRALGLPGRIGALWFLGEAAVMGAGGSLVGALLGALGSRSLLGRLPGELVTADQGVLVGGGFDLVAASLGAALGLVVTLTAALPLALRATWRPPLVGAGASRPPPTGPAERGGQLRASGAAGLALLLLLPIAAYCGWRWLSPERSQAGEGTLQAILVMLFVLLLTVALVRSLPSLLCGLSAGVRNMAAPPLWLRLATDSLRRHGRRTGATAASLSITLASLVGVYGAADSYRHSLETWLDAAVTWDLLVSTGSRDGGASQPLPSAAVAELAAVAGVTGVLPERSVTVSAGGRAVDLVAFDAAAPRPSRRLTSVATLPGIAHTARATTSPTARSLGDALAQDDAIAIAPGLAARLGVALGDDLALATPTGQRTFSVIALVEDRAASTPGAYLDLDSYARAFHDDKVDDVGILLTPAIDPTATIPELVEALQHTLGERYPVEVVSASTFRQEVMEGVAATFAVVRALVLLAVLVALAGLLNAVLIGYWQFRQQFGLLRALGAPAVMLVRTLATEALVMTAAGAASGVLLGTLLSLALLRGLEPSRGPLLIWSPPLDAYLTVALLLLLAGLLGGPLLVGRARATPVVAALRGE